MSNSDTSFGNLELVNFATLDASHSANADISNALQLTNVPAPGDMRMVGTWPVGYQAKTTPTTAADSLGAEGKWL
jgi:hypothetical protein